MEKMTPTAAKELLNNTTKLTQMQDGKPTVMHTRSKYLEALQVLAGAHLGPPTDLEYRQSLKARIEQNPGSMSAPDQSAITEELEKDDSVISASSVAEALTTSAADTQIEQKSWWASLKSFLRL